MLLIQTRSAPRLDLGRFVTRGGTLALLRGLGTAAVSMSFMLRAWGAPACSVPALLPLAPPGMTISSASADKDAGFCELSATVTTQGDSIGVRIGLPVQWNGKLLFEGVGGAVGVLVSPAEGAKRGYAVATTDTGHTGNTEDFSWALRRPEKKLDWAYRGVHEATVAAKALVGKYYGSAIRHAYFRGCSNGGRQGLIEAQRFPEDYDGILSGAPALNVMTTLLGWIWNMQALSASPEAQLTSGEWQLVGRLIRTQCDVKDGLADGLIQDPRRCSLPVEQLRCLKEQTKNCLREPQIETLQKLWHKPVLADGQVLFNEGHGYEDEPSSWGAYASPSLHDLLRFKNSLGAGSMQTSATPPGPSLWQLLHTLIVGQPAFQEMLGEPLLRYMFLDDPDVQMTHFDVRRNGPALARRWSGVFDANNPDLSPYLKRGAKLLIWHGWADTALPPEGTIDYFWRARTAAQQGGYTAPEFDGAVRLYMVPAMPHCVSGAGPSDADMLGVLDRWVESGLIPTAITAVQFTHEGERIRSRPLCPMPLEARYLGRGSVNDASSFHCVDPNTAALN
jgi:Tannase and feruloyl esterase